MAYFSDTEKSTGNTFAAGTIDLKVSNESYVTDPATGVLVKSSATSWLSGDLTIEKFFNFTDIKPGDVGEDTIDLVVGTNPAWGCAKLTLTSNEDNGCTEPELDEGADPDCSATSTDPFDGELAQGIEFVWWADDGDNVLEDNEEATKYYLGPDSITNLLGADKELNLTMADSRLNFFNPGGGPLAANTTYYIGKGWCYGDMTLTPEDDADGDGSPIDRGTGLSCNGSAAGNEGQSDKLTADVEFTVEQFRNNSNFLCPEHVTGR